MFLQKMEGMMNRRDFLTAGAVAPGMFSLMGALHAADVIPGFDHLAAIF